MKQSREERRAALEAKAKEIIDELMQWSEETEQPTLTQIEEEILKLRQNLSERMLEVVLADQESHSPVPGPRCPKCGKEMHYKGTKTRQVSSRVGGLNVPRGSYYCSHCKKSLFPPGSAASSGGNAVE